MRAKHALQQLLVLVRVHDGCKCKCKWCEKTEDGYGYEYDGCKCKCGYEYDGHKCGYEEARDCDCRGRGSSTSCPPTEGFCRCGVTFNLGHPSASYEGEAWS